MELFRISKRMLKVQFIGSIAACVVLLIIFFGFNTSTETKIVFVLTIAFLVIVAISFYLFKTKGPYREPN
jgi:hypothetical protein